MKDVESARAPSPNSVLAYDAPRRPRLRATAFLALCAAALCLVHAAALHRASLLAALLDLLQRAESAGALRGGLVLVALQSLGFVLLIPTSFLNVAAGTAYGFERGLAVAAVGYTVGCILPFVLSRRLLTRTVSERLRAYPLAAGVMAAVEERPRAIIVLLRLSPVLPSPVNCYMLGLTRVGAPTYLAATVVGAAPNWAFTVYVGSLLKHVADAVGGGGAPPWPLLAVGVAATAAVLAVVSRLARAKMAELADPGAVALPVATKADGRRSPWAGRLRTATRRPLSRSASLVELAA